MVKQRERTDWEIIALSVIATVLIMSGIYFIGLQFNDYKVSSMDNDLAQIEADHQSQIVGQRLAEEIARENNCDSLREWRDSSFPRMEELRTEVEAYEQSNRFDHAEYETVKQRYTNMIIQSLIEARGIENKCNETMDEIIYIYTQDCQSCEDQGTVLSYFRQNTDNLYVYPLDSDLDMQPINFLEEYYSVEEYPVIIVEGEPYEGFKGVEELEEIIEENTEEEDL